MSRHKGTTYKRLNGDLMMFLLLEKKLIEGIDDWGQTEWASNEENKRQQWPGTI